MSWLFSQALVEEYLGENFLDGEQSVPLNGNNTPQAYCALDKMTGFSRLSRFGMMFKPLTESRGEELLMSYREDFLAKTSQLREKEMDLTESEAECGEKWHGLLARFDQDSHLWRTVQCSLLEDLNESLQTLPQWGMTVDGELYLLPTLVQNTNENESGLWLTPTVMDGLPPRNPEALERQYQNNRKGRTTHATLREQVVYPPPKEMFPTPTMRDYKGANGFETTKKKMAEGLRAHMGQLPNAVQHLEQKPIGGTLNPTWVEWLMGWPLEWTDLKPLEMDKSPSVPQQLGES
jgi:hypothetical protein